MSKETQNPEPIKVGDIVTLKPLTGVVYENGNKEVDGWGGSFRVQLADGTKVKGVPQNYWQPASPGNNIDYLAIAPDELKPEAIIAREAKEIGMSVEDFMAGVAGGHSPAPAVEH